MNPLPRPRIRPPIVSVVTISHRDLPGLRRTLPSVHAQRGEFEVEHIVIDGGSGSAVEEYLREHDSRLAHWQSEPDQGRYDAMNQGLARAHGDLVWFMHSGDCFSDPGAVAAVLSALENMSGENVRDSWGYGRASLVDAAGGTTGTWGYQPFRLFRFAVGDHPIPHQAAFFGADLLSRIGCYETDFGLAADQLFMLRAAVSRPPVTVNRVLCDFDTGGAGSARPLGEHYADMREAWGRLGYRPFGNRRLSAAASSTAETVARSKLWARNLVRR
jgi:glycosyltransferase involved in cell wall biosynthesis